MSAAHPANPQRGAATGGREGQQAPRPSPGAEVVLRALTSRGLPYGREDSFKLSPGGLLDDRILLGTPARGLTAEALLEIAAELGMPDCYRPLLLEQFPRANMVLLGLEGRDDGAVLKVYLEFWDRLRHRVLATGSSQPALLDVGVKWETRSGAHCRADYVCHPLLSAEDIRGRLYELYGGEHTRPGYEFGTRLVCQAAAINPGASFIYLEVSEPGSPRSSFDLNLYKAGLTVAAGPLLARLARQYGIDDGSFEGLLARVADRPLGHISGGLDRHGRDFATVYYEVTMLDPGPG